MKADVILDSVGNFVLRISNANESPSDKTLLELLVRRWKDCPLKIADVQDNGIGYMKLDIEMDWSE